MSANALMGIGDESAWLRVYIGNIPAYADLPDLTNIRPLEPGEIADIGKLCGNGWRKVFNVYAKLVYALNLDMHNSGSHCNSWQQWRDERLLQAGSDTLLIFSPPDLNNLATDKLHILMGKGYAQTCNLNDRVNWHNHEFASHPEQPLLVCPYFDYRQLSNQKILYLCDLVNGLLSRV